MLKSYNIFKYTELTEFTVMKSNIKTSKLLKSKGQQLKEIV